MKGSFKTALIAAVVSAFVAAGAAVATTQAFTLGTTNTVDAASTVTAGAAGLNAKMLQLTNSNTGSSATALGLTTPGSRPPMIVNSGTKVANLNADKLDGIDSTGFLPKGGKAADSSKLNGYTSGAFYHLQRSGTQQTFTCALANIVAPCATVNVTVPAGHTYEVTVISSVTAGPGPAAEVQLCPYSTGTGCMSGLGFERMTFNANQYGNWSSSATRQFVAGSYAFSTTMQWPFPIPANPWALTTTTVIAYDTRQENLTGP